MAGLERRRDVCTALLLEVAPFVFKAVRDAEILTTPAPSSSTWTY